jgi:hypothetical protein
MVIKYDQLRIKMPNMKYPEKEWQLWLFLNKPCALFIVTYPWHSISELHVQLEGASSTHTITIM